jgi:hypothetical protein
MDFPVQRLWLLAGAVAGYALMMWTNPVRASLWDGWRAMRRYPALWMVLGVVGFVHAVHQVAVRVYLAMVLPPESRPEFRWARVLPEESHGSMEGMMGVLWWLSAEDFAAIAKAVAWTAWESVGGLFHQWAGTFPVAAFVIPLALLVWRGKFGVLVSGLDRRFGIGSRAIAALLIIGGVAATIKLLLLAGPGWWPEPWWSRWSHSVAMVSFAFESLLGVGVQVYLLLLAYAWVRGLNFEMRALGDVALRRFACVLPWTVLVLCLSLAVIEVPVWLATDAAFAAWFPAEEIFELHLPRARAALALFFVLTAGVQVALTLHTSSWRKALRDHFETLRREWWPFGWFVITALVHFFLVWLLSGVIAVGTGEGTALWVAWKLVSPWFAALVGGWLLTSWVCLHCRWRGGAGTELSATSFA